MVTFDIGATAQTPMRVTNGYLRHRRYNADADAVTTDRLRHRWDSADGDEDIAATAHAVTSFCSGGVPTADIMEEPKR